MSHYTLETLKAKLQSDVIGRWHKERRAGNDGNAGNTLEDLLGVKENNLKLPDWGDIEIKTKRKKSRALITLLHREPQPKASIPLLLLSLGWCHKDAGGKYRDDEQSFRSTTRANSFSDRGFAIELRGDKIVFIFDPKEVNVSAKDRTKVYGTYGDWLDDIQKRESHFSSIPPIFWERSYIEAEIKNKLNNTLLVLVKSKKIDGENHFYFESGTLFSTFNASKMQRLFESHSLYIDFDARTGHNHGTKFRIDIKAVSELFDKSLEIF